jgi:hypothetical protein
MPAFEECDAWPVVDAGEDEDGRPVYTDVSDGLEPVPFDTVPLDPEDGLGPDPFDSPLVVGVPNVKPDEFRDVWPGEEPDGEGEAVVWEGKGEARAWEESPGDVC